MRGHGQATGNCVKSDRVENIFVCEISSWCPIENDQFWDKADGPLISGAESYTVFIMNSISFSIFDEIYQKNNLQRGICIFEPGDEGKNSIT